MCFYCALFISACKISARRAKKQVKLDFSEPQPNLKLRSRLKSVQGERKSKSTCIFSIRSLPSMFV